MMVDWDQARCPDCCPVHDLNGMRVLHGYKPPERAARCPCCGAFYELWTMSRLMSSPMTRRIRYARDKDNLELVRVWRPVTNLEAMREAIDARQ